MRVCGPCVRPRAHAWRCGQIKGVSAKDILDFMIVWLFRWYPNQQSVATGTSMVNNSMASHALISQSVGVVGVPGSAVVLDPVTLVRVSVYALLLRRPQAGQLMLSWTGHYARPRAPSNQGHLLHLMPRLCDINGQREASVCSGLRGSSCRRGLIIDDVDAVAVIHPDGWSRNWQFPRWPLPGRPAHPSASLAHITVSSSLSGGGPRVT